jgi:hypothetical protein
MPRDIGGRGECLVKRVVAPIMLWRFYNELRETIGHEHGWHFNCFLGS